MPSHSLAPITVNVAVRTIRLVLLHRGVKLSCMLKLVDLVKAVIYENGFIWQFDEHNTNRSTVKVFRISDKIEDSFIFLLVTYDGWVLIYYNSILRVSFSRYAFILYCLCFFCDL